MVNLHQNEPKNQNKAVKIVKTQMSTKEEQATQANAKE